MRMIINRRRTCSNYIKGIDYSTQYLTFIAKENGTFTFTPQNNNVISYSTDDGNTWTVGNSVQVSSEDKVMWKGTMTPSSSSSLGIGTFGDSTNSFDVQGNVMSLLFGDNFIGQTSLVGMSHAFRYLFEGTEVVNAENLSLPATTLATYCYSFMFRNCKSLTIGPELPATTLTAACYSNMFRNTGLTIAPKLPATKMVRQCYLSMFSACKSLTTAPELPAESLVTQCYSYMFDGCTNLNYIKAMFITKPGTYTSNWVLDVAASGTFVKNSAATWDVTGNNGIPNGWTVLTAAE